MAISKDLLDILVCPVCKTPIELLQDENGLRCPACRLVYPIRDDIPVMLAVLDIRDIDDPVVYQMAAITAANAASRNRSAAWARVARKITKIH